LLILAHGAFPGNLPRDASSPKKLADNLHQKAMKRLPLVLIISALAGCSVGPVFRRPAPPGPIPYSATALPPETASAPVAGGDAQRFVQGMEVPARWWELFRSEPLDRWVRRAIADNPTLAAAEATLRQARESQRAREGSLLPGVDASLSASRLKPSGAASGLGNVELKPFSLFNASVNVSYDLDAFGGTRHALEALRARVDYQRFQLEGATLAISANVVTAAIREASLRAQLQATREVLAVQEEEAAVIEKRARLGSASRLDSLAQQEQIARTRATIPPIEAQLARTRHLLSVLAGRFPGDPDAPPVFELSSLDLPKTLPVSLPSALVRQRPDIRSAEELMRSAGAGVGVATANLYPQITLTADYGSAASTPRDLFSPSSIVWGLGAGLLQPVFRGGALQAERRAAEAAYDQAAALYRETVLQSFRDVADVLRALEYDAVALKAEADAEAAARDTLRLAETQYRLGASGYLALLDAQRRHHQARISLVQAQAARLADSAALFQALGGGWWNER
jgi:NodT family efflux transporter outer membrane factor (OMF) lipoprotein